MRTVWLRFILWLLLCQPIFCHLARADDSLRDIPRVDVHAHCGSPQRMAEYLEISKELEQRYSERLLAWIDLDFLRTGSDVTADTYLSAANERYEHRFLPCLHDAMKDGLQYSAEDIEAWQQRGVVGLKIWVGLSDAIDNSAARSAVCEDGHPSIPWRLDPHRSTLSDVMVQ